MSRQPGRLVPGGDALHVKPIQDRDGNIVALRIARVHSARGGGRPIRVLATLEIGLGEAPGLVREIRRVLEEAE